MFPAFPVIMRAAIAAGVVRTLKKVYHNRHIGAIKGTQWALSVRANGAAAPYISFQDDGEITGFGGCNQFFGHYAQDGDRLTIGTLASTRKACPDMRAETRFISALQSARRIKGTYSEIRIYDDNDDVRLTLKRKRQS